MKLRGDACIWSSAIVLAVWISGCSKPNQGAAGSSTAQPLAAPGFDRCLVGTWRSVDVRLAHKVVQASGGANVEVTIASSGDCVIDFAPMSIVNGTAGNSAFDFRYTGKGSGTFGTPSPGLVSVSQKNITGVRANATVKMPNGAAMPLLTNTPASSLIPREAAAAGSSTQGIDPFPVLSADSYTCSPTQLVLTSSTAFTQWTFNRVGNNPK